MLYIKGGIIGDGTDQAITDASKNSPRNSAVILDSVDQNRYNCPLNVS